MAQRPGNGIALAGMILGVVTILACWIPLFSWILALLGIVLSAVGYARSRRGMPGKGMAITGLASSVLGGAFGIYLTIAEVHALESIKFSFGGG